MANHMAEVAKMLGVELGEEFAVLEDSSKEFRITANGIEVYDVGLWWAGLENASFVLEKLLSGFYSIKRKPWRPNDKETYWYVDERGDIWGETFDNHWASDHINYYKLGNCYHTYKEAEANRDKWVAFYASDEVLEV